MANLVQLRTHLDDGSLRVVIETPAQSQVKIVYDPDEGVFTLARALPLGVIYPYDWGFIPSTRAGDGDPLDAMVFHQGKTWPGVVIACDPVGVVRVSQKEKGASEKVENDRLIAVPRDDPRCRDARDLNPRQREELESFFVSAAMLTGKKIHIKGWGGPKEAKKLIKEAQRQYDRGEDPSEESK